MLTASAMAMRGDKSIILLIFVFCALPRVISFRITGYSGNRVTVTEGSKLTLGCKTDGDFEYCDWSRSFSSCKFEWKRSSRNVERQECSYFYRDRIK